jgi:uncharacterized Tic20 family protein
MPSVQPTGPLEQDSSPYPYPFEPMAQAAPGSAGAGQGQVRRAARVAGQGSERTLAVAAHAAIGFGFFGIGFLLSILISVIIWLVGRKSPYVEAQADRAGRYQIFILLANLLVVLLWAVGLGVFLYLGGWEGWSSGGWRTVAWALLGLVLLVAVPVFLVWYVATILYGLYAALRVLASDDFRYPRHPFSRRGDTRTRRRSRTPTTPDDPLDRPLRWER